MKIKNGFMLRQVAGTYVVLPMAKDVLNFDGMITLNESGVMLWEMLKEECTIEDLVKKITSEYIVSEDDASKDVKEFIGKLVQADCLENI